MKNVHVILVDDTNEDMLPSNSLYVGKLDGENEYLQLKDEYGDPILLRDELTGEVEDLIKNFVSVSTSSNMGTSPKIVFQISDKTTKAEVLEELYNKAKTKENLSPHKEMLQIDNNVYEFIPFLSAHGSYSTITLNKKRSKTTSEALRTLLTEIWQNIDLVLASLWNAYKLFSNMISDLALSSSKQLSRIVLMDINIIETKLRVDNLMGDIADLTWVEKKYVHDIVDLRQFSNSRWYKLNTPSDNGDNMNVGMYMIIQEADLDDGERDKLGMAKIEVLRDKVIDYSQTDLNKCGIFILPDEGSDDRPIIALSGGAKYHVFRTPKGTPVVAKQYEEITALVNNFKKYKYFTGRNLMVAEVIKMESDGIAVFNGDERFTLSIKNV